jgi:predicted TPR repeat methyltransferase
MQRLHLKKSKEDIVHEYACAASCAEEYKKVKWGSKEGMMYRFKLCKEIVDWSLVDTWIDFGCGTGELFRVIEGSSKIFAQLVGVDITSQLLDIAKNKEYSSPVLFICADLAEYARKNMKYDLVTMIGVLQQCGEPPEKAIPYAVVPLKMGGQFFLTTKNIEWEEFSQGHLVPDKTHSWFCYDELRDVLEKTGMEIAEYGGFLPREGRVVPLCQSHSMFILSRKVRNVK